MANGDVGTTPGQKASHLRAQARLDGPAGHEVVPVLTGILMSACQLTGAAFGVALVGDSDHGVTDIACAGIPEQNLGDANGAPGWHAFLAALLEAPQPLLLKDVRAHRASYHVPDRHPAMTNLLGAPLHLRDGSSGYLYVANKAEGEEFSPEDERTVLTLAAAAGLAVHAHRLVRNKPRRLRWLDAIAELVHLLHGDVERETGLRSVADLLREAAGADTSVIALIDPGDEEGHVIVDAASGLGAELMSGARLPRTPFLDEAIDTDRPIVSDDVTQDVHLAPPIPWVPSLSVLGPGLFLPLRTPTTSLGAMFVAWRRDSPQVQHVESIATLAIPFARAAALVLQRHDDQQVRIRQQRWMDAGAEITRLLLEEVAPHEVMSTVTRQIRSISGAAYTAIALTDHLGPQRTVIFDVIDGLGLEHAAGVRVPCPNPLAMVIESGQPIIASDISRDARYDPPPAWRDALSDLGLVMFMPLQTRREIQGALIVGWRRGSPEERIARNDAPLVESFADKIALSLQRVRTNEDRDRRQGWLDACGELTRRLAGDADQDATLRRVIRLLRKVSGADFGAIIMLDQTPRDSASLVILEGYGERHYTRHQISHRGLVAAAIESGRIFVSEDFTQEEGYNPPPEMADQLSSVGLGMVIPLVASGEILGALFAGWRRGSPHERPARREVALVETFADQTAIALQRGRVQLEHDRSERWLEATAEMARLLIGEVDRDEAMALVIRQLRGISGADVGGVLLVDPIDPTSMRVVDFRGPGIPPVSPDARSPRIGLVARVIETGQPFVSEDYPHQPGHNPPAEWRDALSKMGLGMIMPLTAGDEVLGVLFAGWLRDSPHAAAAREESTEVQTVADLAALALQRVRAQDDRERVHLLEDRELIAYKLHDAVLQRLFAVGLRLHSASAVSTEPPVQHRLRQAVDDLEATTDRVRSTIEHLSGDGSDPDGTSDTDGRSNGAAG
ncbi:GAF domain-containing protein [Actinopolymorpha sp. B9G3]|uniref:GAF domain-containing protein n=1 Tax=Actinopolymorpha sp. B9G3 TaxID=3158970 RepID=UPI0032D9310A